MGNTTRKQGRFAPRQSHIQHVLQNHHQNNVLLTLPQVYNKEELVPFLEQLFYVKNEHELAKFSSKQLLSKIKLLKTYQNAINMSFYDINIPIDIINIIIINIASYIISKQESEICLKTTHNSQITILVNNGYNWIFTRPLYEIIDRQCGELVPVKLKHYFKTVKSNILGFVC